MMPTLPRRDRRPAGTRAYGHMPSDRSAANPARSRTRGRTATGDTTSPANEPVAGPRDADERAIGVALATTWALISGRWLPAGTAPHDLTDCRLIDFWADDYRDEERPVVPDRAETQKGQP
jgi:hypothetical protein